MFPYAIRQRSIRLVSSKTGSNSVNFKMDRLDMDKVQFSYFFRKVLQLFRIKLFLNTIELWPSIYGKAKVLIVISSTIVRTYLTALVTASNLSSAFAWLLRNDIGLGWRTPRSYVSQKGRVPSPDLRFLNKILFNSLFFIHRTPAFPVWRYATSGTYTKITYSPVRFIHVTNLLYVRSVLVDFAVFSLLCLLFS